MHAGPCEAGQGLNRKGREQHPEETVPGEVLPRVSQPAFEGVEQTASWHGLAATAANVNRSYIAEIVRGKSARPRPRTEVDFLVIHEEALVEPS